MYLEQTLYPQMAVSSFTQTDNSSSFIETTRMLVNGIKYTISSMRTKSSILEIPQYKFDTRDFLQKMEFHADYPVVSPIAEYFANDLCKTIYDSEKVTPSRTANSVEGGVALVYSRKKGLLRKKYQEVFIECYNDSTAVISLTENYELKKINEVSLEDKKIVLNYITEVFKS